jgi:energy-coupling factor transporter ATP-binding protein EcfA2
MKLLEVTIQLFKNIVDAQTFKVEGDVTCLIGKNESGKTTILKALHRLKPANGESKDFDLVTEYPRWRLSKDRRSGNPEQIQPVAARFLLDEEDLTALESIFSVRPPDETICVVARNYRNEVLVRLECPLESVIKAAAVDASVASDNIEELASLPSVAEAQAKARELAKELKTTDAARSKVLSAYPAALAKYDFITSGTMEQEAQDALFDLVPQFFYFSTYDLLPGEVDLTALAQRVNAGAETLTPGERTMVALLARAGEEPGDFLDTNYDSRRAELQASSSELTRRVFEYWKQNTDLDVEFDTDMVPVGTGSHGNPVYHRILKVQLRDARHGGVATNFATRSSGFQWFFSFFAAFSEHQESTKPLVVLLDEPGTSLHGEAQKDFVRFVYEELGTSKQTLYTTHSQHMVDPTRYEKIRAVHDRATRQNPELGVKITPVNLSADRDTMLPLEAALGYTISQHLFLGSGQHLAVEGSSDFVYLQRMTEFLITKGESGLDDRLAVVSVGGADNMPAFVALLGRRLRVSALIDGLATSRQMERTKKAARDNGVDETHIVAVSEIGDLPSTADVEDLFDVDDYLRLYNWAFSTSLSRSDLPATTEPILKRLRAIRGEFDHALPAHALTAHKQEFFNNISPTSIERFKKLFARLNATLEAAG